MNSAYRPHPTYNPHRTSIFDSPALTIACLSQLPMKRKSEHLSYKLARLKPIVLTAIALLTALVSHN